MAAYRPSHNFPSEDSPRLKAAAERCEAFEGDASCSANGEGVVATVVIVFSSDEEE
jgi:hypothetical protein